MSRKPKVEKTPEELRKYYEFQAVHKADLVALLARKVKKHPEFLVNYPDQDKVDQLRDALVGLEETRKKVALDAARKELAAAQEKVKALEAAAKK